MIATHEPDWFAGLAARPAAAGRGAGGVRAYRALLRKDLLLELRGRELVPAMVVFVLGALVLVRLGLGGETLAGGTRAATGLLWVVVVFTSMLALVRSFAQEREHGIWDGLLSAPADRSAIWAARASATFLFLGVTQAVALPLFWLFFLQDGRSPSLAVLAAALALADLGVAMLGALLAGLVSNVRAREVLLPVLFLPFALPLVTRRGAHVGGLNSPAKWRFGRHFRGSGFWLSMIRSLRSWAGRFSSTSWRTERW